MIRKITLLFLACLGMSSLSMAQKCGTDEIDRYLLQTNPAYVAELARFNQQFQLQSSMQSLLVNTLTPADSFYEIPVVVHVMSDQLNGDVGARSITSNTNYPALTDNYIKDLVENYLTKSFNATWPGYPNTSSGGVSFRYKFVMAKRSPNCTPTNGIVRVNATSLTNYVATGIKGTGTAGPGEDDDNVKALSIWPPDRYYNIWIVNKIKGWDGTSGGGTTGFAYVPPGNPADRDGAVILAPFFLNNETTTVHEVGHSLGLHHPFKDEGTLPPPNPCPPNGNCFNDNDFVCDTEPFTTVGTGSCPLGGPPNNPCTGLPYGTVSYNFMNYTTCQNRYTVGQRARSMAIFFEYRASLVSSLGGTAFPVTPLPGVCAIAGSTTLPNSFYGPRDIVIRRTGADTVFRNNSGNYTADGNQFYIDNTCKQRAQLQANRSHTMRIGLSPSSAIQQRVRVYIDYNNNGSFADPGELLYYATGRHDQSGGTIAQFNFTPPLTAVNCQPLRMRVMADRDLPLYLGGPCAPMVDGQTEDYEVVIKGSGTTSSTPGLATIIKPPFEGNPSCLGSGVTVAATYLNTITPVAYRWFRKLGTPPYTVTDITNLVPPATGADSFVLKNDWNDLDTVWAKVAYPGLCGVDTTLTDSIVLYRPITVAPAVTIGITKGTNPGCPDDTVRFTVTGNVNPGGGPQYEWFVNGVTQGAPSGTPYFETWNVPSGTTFRVRMTNPNVPSPCGNPGFANSNVITYTHTTKVPTLNIALISGTNPGCPNQALSFKATGTTLGTTPTYTWKVNGGTVQTGSSDIYTSVLNNNDVVSCTVLSSTSCAVPNTANSTNTITITHTPLIADVTIQQISGNSPACTGHWMVFVATPTNSGANPQFQWLVNNAPVNGANSPIFSTKSLLNGDFVSCILISTDPCVQNTFDTSAILPMVITTSKMPTLTVAITKGNNPGCLDSLVEFTATDKDLGTGVNFDWLVNGFQTFNGQVFSTSNLLNGDVVVCRANQTDNGCYLPDTVFSAPITMVRSITPDPPIISLVNNQLVTNKTGSFVWFGPGGQLVGGENGSFHPTELGQYYCVTNNNGCWSKPSNKLTITLLDITTYNINQVNIYPNPTTGQVVLDWGGHNVTMKVGVYSTVGQKLMETNVVKQTRKTLDLGKLANGVYFIVITDEQGHSGTARITVTK